MRYFVLLVLIGSFLSVVQADAPWQQYRGKAGPSGWRCHVIQPDPQDHGPDGINLHDWDADGDLDMFVNVEEGKFSRLYFNPGPGKVRDLWSDYVEFKHGKCEDSGMGDLDNDGDMDYIANGGWVYFNPGASLVRERSQWVKMTLFDEERRVPTVADVDGDGLTDLIVGAQAWYRQPAEGKHDPANWRKYTLGKNRWPMNCIMTDVDKDGDTDMVVPDRGVEICWYVNPGPDKVTGPWQRKTLHTHHEPMFMTVADVNGDRTDDFIITGGSKGDLAETLIVLLRTNRVGEPTFKEILIDQPGDSFPKGVAVMELDGELSSPEILVIPKQGDIWMATYHDDATQAKNWMATCLTMPGAQTRMKMDNAWLGDLDADGDLDIVTTEENGGWGVIWFENPGTQK
ncbi:MAG: VCBS repeat-containing protein [Planctomycetes bacterium]|nr:VCBS repeat-containing protein [Planctomycetota bacterium]